MIPSLTGRSLLSSLRSRLLLLVLLAVVPALGLILYTGLEQREAAAERVQAGALSLARVLAHEQETTLEQAHHLLEGIGHLPIIWGGDPEACREVVTAILHGSQRFVNIGVLSLEGRLTCSARDVPPGTPPSPGLRRAFRKALATGEFASSGFNMGRMSRRPMLMLAHPATDAADRVRAVTYTVLDLAWLNRLAAEADLPEGSSLTIVDNAGRVLARYPDSEAWVGEAMADEPLVARALRSEADLTFTSAELDGTSRLYASTPLNDDGAIHGRVIVGIPEAVAFAPVTTALRRNLVTLAAVLLLALLAVWLGGDFFIARRVNGLLAATRRLNDGDLGTRTGIPHGPGELEQLAQAFDEMAESLQRRQEEAERTAGTLKRQALVFDTLSEGVLVTDAEGTIIDWNRGAERLFGYRRDEVLGRSPSLFHDPALDDRREAEILEALVREGRWAGELPFVRRDGTEGISEVAVVAQYDDRGERIAHIGVNRDITDRKRTEQALARSQEELRQSQKMEAIGRLAGGIAHDFNNLLTAIKGNVELALLELPPASDLRRDLEQVRQAADTAATLTRQLLSFSRKQAVERRVLDLNEVVSNTCRMLQRLIGEDIQLDTHLDADLAPVEADPAQMEQVLINLAVNARDAMPGGGCLTLETANLELAAGTPSPFPSAEPGDYVLLTVSDNGSGMDAQTLQRIFEPFFTTKQKGKGTGLGLFAVYGVVNQSGGHIAVESAPGRGTVFRILLPRSVSAPETARPPAEVPLPRGSETILLVEDEPPVRLLARKLLQRIGYRVLEASNGEEALRVAAGHAEEIDLMLTDVIMPRMSGRDLADRMSALRPAMKVIFMSGYTDEVVLPLQRDGGSPLFLQKPFTLQGLTQVVRDTLDTPMRKCESAKVRSAK